MLSRENKLAQYDQSLMPVTLKDLEYSKTIIQFLERTSTLQLFYETLKETTLSVKAGINRLTKSNKALNSKYKQEIVNYIDNNPDLKNEMTSAEKNSYEEFKKTAHISQNKYTDVFRDQSNYCDEDLSFNDREIRKLILNILIEKGCDKKNLNADQTLLTDIEKKLKRIAKEKKGNKLYHYRPGTLRYFIKKRVLHSPKADAYYPVLMGVKTLRVFLELIKKWNTSENSNQKNCFSQLEKLITDLSQTNPDKKRSRYESDDEDDLTVESKRKVRKVSSENETIQEDMDEECKIIEFPQIEDENDDELTSVQILSLMGRNFSAESTEVTVSMELAASSTQEPEEQEEFTNKINDDSDSDSDEELEALLNKHNVNSWFAQSNTSHVAEPAKDLKEMDTSGKAEEPPTQTMESNEAEKSKIAEWRNFIDSITHRPQPSVSELSWLKKPYESPIVPSFWVNDFKLDTLAVNPRQNFTIQCPIKNGFQENEVTQFKNDAKDPIKLLNFLSRAPAYPENPVLEKNVKLILRYVSNFPQERKFVETYELFKKLYQESREFEKTDPQNKTQHEKNSLIVAKKIEWCLLLFQFKDDPNFDLLLNKPEKFPQIEKLVIAINLNALSYRFYDVTELDRYGKSIIQSVQPNHNRKA